MVAAPAESPVGLPVAHTVSIEVRAIDGRQAIVAAWADPGSAEQPESEARLAALTRDWTTEQWAQLLSVRVEGLDEATTPPVLGSYRVAAQQIQFFPRFPLRPGVGYRVVLRRSRLPGAAERLAPIEQRIELPAPEPDRATRVEAIYPTADRLPANLLKIYIQFSAPVRQGVSWEHLHLRTADGAPVDAAFVNVGQELWDPAGERLTVLFDPGRVKHGIRPNRELGAVLSPGVEYVLTIDAAWRDAAGRPLAAAFEKRFTTLEPDSLPPDPRRWEIDPPRAGSAAPLSVRFDEPMDAALAEHSLRVLAPRGHEARGAVSVDQHATRWRFTPAQPWAAGEYTLRVDGRLEDLAAHSVGRPFEVPIAANGATPDALDHVDVTFVVEQAAEE